MAFKKNIMKGYRKAFGHKSPFRRVYGSRNPGQAIGVTYRQGYKVAMDLAKLRSELKGMKARQNNEKKHIDTDLRTDNVAQANFNSDGASVFDVTPTITQGVDQDQRIGNSLKLTGLSLPMSFTQQYKTQGDRLLRISLLRVRSADNGVSVTEAFNQTWDVNPLTGLRDFNAPRAYRSGSHDGITVVRSKVIKVKGPIVDGASAGTVQQQEKNVTNVRFNVKLDDILRYESSAATAPDGVKYYIVIQCNSGNMSNSFSNLDIPIGETLTGIEYRATSRAWWIDN
jgi:hypothetical protein